MQKKENVQKNIQQQPQPTQQEQLQIIFSALRNNKYFLLMKDTKNNYYIKTKNNNTKTTIKLTNQELIMLSEILYNIKNKIIQEVTK